MGSSLGFLISLFFLVQAMAFAGDLCSLQMAYSNLNAVATTAAHQISIKGYADDEIRKTLYEQGKAYLVIPDETYAIGDTVLFEVWREYRPLYLSKEPMKLTVKRSIIVGYI